MVYSNAKVCEAKLISEGKTRFICDVDYQGKSIECYVPNTCKLSKLIHLNHNDVLITKNLRETNRTQYTLFAFHLEVIAGEIYRNLMSSSDICFLSIMKGTSSLILIQFII